MHLGIVGTGAMGSVVLGCAREDSAFDRISVIEPMQPESWPSERVDLLVDFSHHSAVYQIYDYCRRWNGEEAADEGASGGKKLAVVLATTGYGEDEEKVIEDLAKVCRLVRKTNFSRGVAGFLKAAEAAKAALGSWSDVRILELHHDRKKDAPSGTAKTLAERLGMGTDEYSQKITSLRMGTVFGEHRVYFAMEDEMVEIRHTAYSKRIFALGALEEGKRLLGLTDG